MLNDYVDYYSQVSNYNDAITKMVGTAKIRFGENVPYKSELRLLDKGIYKTYVFDDIFILSMDKTLLLGCMSYMNYAEAELFEKFMRYADNNVYRDISSNSERLLRELDERMYQELIQKIDTKTCEVI